MTRVCLVGTEDENLRYELLSRETARDALATYDLREPFANTVAVETVSLGAAVSLLNDLNWYLVRFTDAAFVLEPSISETEWLSRDLAAAVRDDGVLPAETDRFLKVYGVVEPGTDDAGPTGGDDASGLPSGDDADGATHDRPNGTDRSAAEETEPGPGGQVTTDGSATDEEATGPPRLTEPMLVTRTGETIPEYDLREVDDTLVVRVTEDEFGA